MSGRWRAASQPAGAPMKIYILDAQHSEIAAAACCLRKGGRANANQTSHQKGALVLHPGRRSVAPAVTDSKRHFSISLKLHRDSVDFCLLQSTLTRPSSGMRGERRRFMEASQRLHA
jgi:hypothetical protein